MTGKSAGWDDPDTFPDINFLKPTIPVFVQMDLDLRTASQVHVPGWTIQVVSESTAVARRRHYYFSFGSIQIFGDLALGQLRLGHPDFSEGGGGAEMWFVRSGNLWQFYKYGSKWIA